MSSRSSFSYSKPSLNVSFSVDGLNLDPDSVFGTDQDLFHHHVFRGEDTRASFTSHLSASLQSAGINVFKDGQTADLAGFVIINSRNESVVIKDIVENVTYLLDKTDFFLLIIIGWESNLECKI